MRLLQHAVLSLSYWCFRVETHLFVNSYLVLFLFPSPLLCLYVLMYRLVWFWFPTVSFLPDRPERDTVVVITVMRSLVFVVLLVLCAVADVRVAHADIALDFTSEILLQNAVLNSSYNVTDAFLSSVEGILQDSLGASTLSARVYKAYPHLVVSSEVWYSGATATVETSVATINATYQDLASGGSRAMDVSGKLSYLCMRSIGQQPTVVNYTNNCSFFDQTIPPTSPSSTCLRNLSVAIYTNSSDPSAMRTALCSFLPTDCELITNATATPVSVTISGTAVSVYLMPFAITSQDREATLALLVAYANYASFLVEQKIVYILVNGVRVFYQGDMQQLWTTGTMGQCVQRMWYLIFLIILVPVILIISQQMFYWGRRSGRRSVKNAEADIRAGVSRSMNPWASYAAAGYQYGPPQGYPGGYPGGFSGGNEMQMQGNPFMQQGGQPQQLYGQQFGGPQQFNNAQQQQQYGGYQQQQFGGPPQATPQPQQQYGFPQQGGQSGGLVNRNAQWSYNGQQPQQQQQQPQQSTGGQWGGGYGAGGAQAGWGQQR